MENNYQLTEAGYAQLKDELEDLKGVKRNENLEALKEARSQGDLSENADYDAARDEQARIESRIKEIENILKHSEIIKENSRSKVIGIGKTVTLNLIKDDKVLIENKEYIIVGNLEANPFEGRISNESPLGKALIGKKKGKQVTYKAENGQEMTVEIVDFK
ncbi:MAG TPA: transcription elongation factor GreA [Bacillota bacterium]|nr:transcription elongation factor GreA [Bacillota bacterium]HPJ24170.1 transcription elongation factor GreA [Bacillota bacterium]